MPQINILNVLQGDNQSTIVDKLNYNFDQILSAGGGPQGQQGFIGPTGPIGPQGPQGVQGIQGPSGTKWFVQDTSPASGAITGSSPWNYPAIGDYWLDPDSANQEIYVFTATGWVDSGYGLAAGDIFQRFTPISLNGGATGKGIFIAGTASDNSVILSDASIADYTPGASAIGNTNYENSKLKIATDLTRQKLISFGRSNYDTTSETGSASSLKNPSIQWTSVAPSGTGDYDITFTNPAGSINISSNMGGGSGGINMYSQEEITAESATQNIQLKTASVGKGVFTDVATGGAGFFEVSNLGGSTVNQNYPHFYSDSVGAGIGVGTGQFKSTGNDARKLSVLGNVSISKTVGKHTGTLFTGSSLLPANNNKGSLYVEGFVGIGTTDPTAYNGSTIPLNTTGPAEAQGAFPQLWVSSPNYGPGLQVKTRPSSSTGALSPPNVASIGRTVIGDGVFDAAAVSSSFDKISGTGPDFSQELFLNSGYLFGARAALISYQQKISNSLNTTGNAPVFAITTYSPTSVGPYSPGITSGLVTTIQVRNSNNQLDIMSNGTGSASLNNVNIGARNSYLLNVKAGTTTDPGYGNIKIGNNAGTNNGVVGSLPGNINFYSPGSDGPYRNHSLTVSGIQTIGTEDPLSSFSVSSSSTGAGVSNYTNLKIHRNLYSGVHYAAGGHPDPFSYFTGPKVNNYPNGIEITSDIGDDSGTSFIKGLNRSVAIAVSARNLFESRPIPFGKGTALAAPTNGFFVSDTGHNVSIGGLPLYGGAALDVSASPGGNAVAINTQGDLSVVGNTDILGNLGVTGDVSILNGGLIILRNSVQFPHPFVPLTSSTDWFLSPTNEQSAPYDWPAVNYDRYITVQAGSSGSGNARYECYAENNIGSGSYYLPERRVMDAYSSVSFLVAAGCRFRVVIANTSGFQSYISIISKKFGR